MKIKEHFDLIMFFYNYLSLYLHFLVTSYSFQDRKDLESICDSWYLNLVRILNPEVVIAIGEYMERRTKELCKNSDVNVQIIRMPHPSPRALNNQNWPEKAETFLKDKNLIQYFQNQ